MKRTILASMITAMLMLTIPNCLLSQTKPAAPPRYKDVVVDNPNAESDLKTVGDYINALVAADYVKAKSFLSDNYMGHGPSPKDSSNRDQTIAGWQENAKTQLNPKTSFVSQTFRVTQGNEKGDWISVWGDYSFTQNGTEVKFPYQYTAHITNGKIDRSGVYYDRLYIMETLGFKVVPPPGQ